MLPAHPGHLGGLVVGRVKVSDTDPFEIRVYADEPEDVIKSRWVDFTDAGEVVFTVTTCNVVRHVAIDYSSACCRPPTSTWRLWR